MTDTDYPFMHPKRASLEGLVGDISKLVARGATPEQWAEWLGCRWSICRRRRQHRPLQRADRGWGGRECGMEGL